MFLVDVVRRICIRIIYNYNYNYNFHLNWCQNDVIGQNFGAGEKSIFSKIYEKNSLWGLWMTLTQNFSSLAYFYMCFFLHSYNF